MLNELRELRDLCKASVTIEFNPHRDYYQTIEQFLRERPDFSCIEEETGPEVLAKMVEEDQLVTVQAYPLTPLGFHYVVHYDVEEAVEAMLKILKKP